MLISINNPSQVEVRNQNVETVVEIKSDMFTRNPELSKEIDRLSLKYDISSSTVREIIKCEGLEKGKTNENKINGKTWSKDLGWLQINDFYHTGPMNKLGLDINDKGDSLEYGFILMKKEGLKPWDASKKCWGPKI